MGKYSPGRQDDPELKRIAQAINSSFPIVPMDVLYASPLKVTAGMLVVADGTSWNPGSGEGLYRRDKTNAAWVFIG